MPIKDIVYKFYKFKIDGVNINKRNDKYLKETLIILKLAAL